MTLNGQSDQWQHLFRIIECQKICLQEIARTLDVELSVQLRCTEMLIAGVPGSLIFGDAAVVCFTLTIDDYVDNGLYVPSLSVQNIKWYFDPLSAFVL